MTTLEFYTSQYETARDQAANLKKRSSITSWLRLVLFLGGMVGFYFTLQTQVSVLLIYSLAFIILFLALVRYNATLSERLTYWARKRELLDKELKALQLNLSFPDGQEFQEANHAFSNDLDLFGKASIFQFLNRTFSHIGSESLADLLKNPLKDSDILKQRQESTKELAKMPEWMLEWRTQGTELSLTKEKLKAVSAPKEAFPSLPFGIPLLALPLSYMGIFITMAILSYFNLVPSKILLFQVLIGLGLTTWFQKYFKRSFNQVSRISSSLEQISILFKQIENTSFKSSDLNELKGLLLNKEESASKASKKLASILKMMESRFNIISGFLLNALALWDILTIAKHGNWQERHGGNIENWLKVLGQMETRISLATVYYNNPDYTFPSLNKQNSFSITAREMGHPLLQPQSRVCNDFHLKENGTFHIITGANMAGKSTFLRTLGVNMVMAQIGAPVCAKDLALTPIGLFTSMRTTDSLTDNTSYFFAELYRLKQLKERISKGEQIFIILDEILKGTNSQDKLKGSQAFIRQMVSLGTQGVIATHDLDLCHLETELPKNVQNFCFEVSLDGSEMTFDYLLRQGITQNMNASHLMKEMGII